MILGSDKMNTVTDLLTMKEFGYKRSLSKLIQSVRSTVCVFTFCFAAICSASLVAAQQQSIYDRLCVKNNEIKKALA